MTEEFFDIEMIPSETNDLPEPVPENTEIPLEIGSIFGTSKEDLTNYEPTEDSDIHNASEAMEWFECQGDTNRCAQYAQMFVIEEFLDTKLDMEEFAAISEANGWFSETNGTTLEDMNKMLDYYGIENEAVNYASFDELVKCLDEGGRAIVAVDADEFWYGEGFFGDLFDLDLGANHAIEVIGYDAEREVVIVNDSGPESGCGEEIPLDAFLDAWSDSLNYMIECYDTQEALPPDGTPDPFFFENI